MRTDASILREESSKAQAVLKEATPEELETTKREFRFKVFSIDRKWGVKVIT